MTPTQRTALLGKLRVHGACSSRDVDPNLFFAKRANHRETLPLAKAVCRDCPLVDECAEYAIPHERYGVWGGLSEEDRRKMRRRLGIRLNDVEGVPA